MDLSNLSKDGFCDVLRIALQHFYKMRGATYVVMSWKTYKLRVITTAMFSDVSLSHR